jgi:hypothetical protein
LYLHFQSGLRRVHEVEARRKIPRPALALALLALLATGVVAARVEPLDPGKSCCDMLFYRSMAYNLFRVTRPEMNEPPPGISLQSVYDDPYFGKYYEPENRLNRQPPYVYRPAAPLIARAIATLPSVDIDRAFRALAFVSLWATAFFVGMTVLDISGSLTGSAAALLTLTALHRITAYHHWNSTMADPLALALLALAVWLMFRRADGWFLAVAALGLFSKETVALVLICYVLLLAVERRLALKPLVCVGAIVAVYLAYRLTIPIPNNTLTISNAYLGPPGPKEIAAVAFVVFGPLVLFAATRLWFSRQALVLTPLAAGLFPLAMLTPDRERLYVYAFPLVFVAVFAHPARSWIAKLARIAPAALTIAYTQPLALFEGLSHNDWRLLAVISAFLVEPIFILSSRLWERWPFERPATRSAA